MGQTKHFRFIKDSIKYNVTVRLFGDITYREKRHFRIDKIVIDGNNFESYSNRYWREYHPIVWEECKRFVAGSSK